VGWTVAAHRLLQEKFLTIRLALCGRGSLGRDVNDELVFQLKEAFKRLQVPFARLAEATGRRHSFISYNFVFRRLFDLLGCSHLGTDFPPLKSRKKREDIVQIWLALVRDLQWPYLNSDVKLFGTGHHIDIWELDRRAAAPTRKKRRTNASPPHSEHSGPGLRQPCDNGASRQDSRGQSDTELSDFCAALQRAAGDWDCGLGYGNC
jgi:hypothetical protein